MFVSCSPAYSGLMHVYFIRNLAQCKWAQVANPIVKKGTVFKKHLYNPIDRYPPLFYTADEPYC